MNDFRPRLPLNPFNDGCNPWRLNKHLLRLDPASYIILFLGGQSVSLFANSRKLTLFPQIPSKQTFSPFYTLPVYRTPSSSSQHTRLRLSLWYPQVPPFAFYASPNLSQSMTLVPSGLLLSSTVPNA